MVTVSRRSLDERQGAHFDDRSSTWTDRYRHSRSFQSRLAVVGQAVTEVLAAKSDARVLDFGGGTGVFSAVASQHADMVVCLDRSESMLKEGSSHTATIQDTLIAAGFDHQIGRIARVAASDCNIFAPSATFDLILVVAVLEYVDDCQSFMKSLASSLSPDGLILLTIPDPHSYVRRLQRLLAPLASYGRQTSTRLADQSFVGLRPHGDDVPWRSACDAARLEVADVEAVPLTQSGVGKMVRPTILVTLRHSSPAT
jgi:2-polyprenyl-3-methyl-5-hydroxy-6-metoxy-1,4-benzoquinol methylase